MGLWAVRGRVLGGQVAAGGPDAGHGRTRVGADRDVGQAARRVRAGGALADDGGEAAAAAHHVEQQRCRAGGGRADVAALARARHRRRLVGRRRVGQIEEGQRSPISARRSSSASKASSALAT